jgi:hypothetical protein
MGFPSEEELAHALAEAVENHAADLMSPTGDRAPPAIEKRLDDLLYRHGSDGLMELSIWPSRPKWVRILGIVIWVSDQTLGPIEVEFQFDKAGGAVKALTVRAGDDRTSPRDRPKYQRSSRALQRIIANRPTADEDWTYVVHCELD